MNNIKHRLNDDDLLKLSFEWCKHLSTLSTGSILLMVTFIEKLSSQPDWKILLSISLVGFVATIIGSLGVQLEHLIEQGYGEPTKLGFIAGLMAILGFLLGILSLTIFGLKNL